MLKFMISGLALSALVASGCKPASNSSVKSLDNFAAGKNLHWNDCRAPSESTRAERLPFAKAINIDVVGRNATGNKAKLVSAVQDSLTAVPREYLAMFYAAGGSFVISDETPQLCTDLFKSTNPQSPDVESCHIFMAKAGKPSVSILMKADERTIRGSVKNSVSSLTTLDRLGKGNRHEVKVEYRKV